MQVTYRIIGLVLFVIFGLLISQFVAMVVALPFFGFSLDAVFNTLQNPPQNSQGRFFLLYLQGFTASGAFVLSPWLYLKQFESKPWGYLFGHRQPAALQIKSFGGALLVTLAVMPFNAWVFAWNMQWKFPSWMAGFELWAQTNEQRLRELTVFITAFSNIGEFLLGLLVIAMVPALGEEILFRGILQRQVAQKIPTGWAVWAVAFIFSFIHFQFYGLVPRMILGVLFGYLFAWSGNLWIAVWAHFVNNGFTIVMVYLYHLRLVAFDIEQTPQIPLSTAMTSLVLTCLFLWVFRRNCQTNLVALPTSDKKPQKLTEAL